LGPNEIEEGISETIVSVGGERSRVVIGEGVLKQLGACVRKHLGGKTCAIISDTNVAPLFADRVKRSLTSGGFRPLLITIPAGEKSKTLKQAGTICDQMIAAGLDRR